MNSRRKVLLFVTLAVTIGLFAYDRQPKEPVYEGKTLSEWLEDLYRKGGELRPHSAEALRQMGPDAVPHLKRMLRARDSWPKRKLMDLASKQPLINVPLVPANYENQLALNGCDVLGQDAREAIPEIEALLPEEPDGLGMAAARVLARIGQEGVMPLVAGLASSDSQVRHNSARGLVECRFDASAAVPGLIKLLDDPDPYIALTAGEALGAIRQKADVTVPALVRCLTQQPRKGFMPAVAAAALWRFGNRAREAVPSLLGLVHDRSPGARHAAARALARIDPDAAERFVPELLVKLESQDGIARAEAARELGIMALQPARVVPALMKHLPDSDPDVRDAVVSALSHFGGEAQLALPTLRERCKDVNTIVSANALAAVRDIEPRLAVPFFCNRLNSQFGVVSDEAARQLGTFGPAAKAAVPDLLVAFRKGDEYSRAVILEALKKVDPEAARSLESEARDPRRFKSAAPEQQPIPRE